MSTFLCSPLSASDYSYHRALDSDSFGRPYSIFIAQRMRMPNAILKVLCRRCNSIRDIYLRQCTILQLPVGFPSMNLSPTSSF